MNNPETWETYHQLGENFLGEGKLSDAIFAYQKALELYPDSFWSYHKLAQTFIELKQWENSIQASQKAISLDASFPWCYHNLGDALQQLQQWEKAIEAYQTAINLDIKFSWSYYNLGLCQSQVKNWELALISYLQALQLEENLSGIYYHLGQSFIHLETLSPSGQEFLRNQSIDVYVSLAEHLQQEHQLEAIKSLHKILLDIHPNPSQIITKSPGLSQINLLLEDLSPYYSEIAKNPQLSLPYYHLGTALVRQNQSQEASQAYQQAIQLNPDFYWWFYYNIWETLKNTNQLDSIIDFYQKFLAQNPQSFWGYLNLGEAFTRNHQIPQAIPYYQKASYQKVLKERPIWQNSQEKLTPILSPNFIIIGVQRGGTTSLYSYLIQHPQILSPIKKEMDFFSWNYQHGLDWYLSHFPPQIPSGNFLTGEASPSYIHHLDAPQRLFQCFPETKLILLLRNPIDRTLSHYHHWRQLNWEYRPLEMVIENEIKHLENSSENFISEEPGNYIAYSLYLKFIRKWRELFPPEHLLILPSEDLYQNPSLTLSKIYEFLELSPYPLPEYPNINPGNYFPISDSLKTTLKEYFKPHNQDLEIYLDQQFHWDL